MCAESFTKKSDLVVAGSGSDSRDEGRPRDSDSLRSHLQPRRKRCTRGPWIQAVSPLQVCLSLSLAVTCSRTPSCMLILSEHPRCSPGEGIAPRGEKCSSQSGSSSLKVLRNLDAEIPLLWDDESARSRIIQRLPLPRSPFQLKCKDRQRHRVSDFLVLVPISARTGDGTAFHSTDASSLSLARGA